MNNGFATWNTASADSMSVVANLIIVVLIILTSFPKSQYPKLCYGMDESTLNEL